MPGSNNVINAPAPVLETETNLKEGISKAKLVRYSSRVCVKIFPVLKRLLGLRVVSFEM